MKRNSQKPPSSPTSQKRPLSKALVPSTPPRSGKQSTPTSPSTKSSPTRPPGSLLAVTQTKNPLSPNGRTQSPKSTILLEVQPTTDRKVKKRTRRSSSSRNAKRVQPISNKVVVKEYEPFSSKLSKEEKEEAMAIYNSRRPVKEDKKQLECDPKSYGYIGDLELSSGKRLTIDPKMGISCLLEIIVKTNCPSFKVEEWRECAQRLPSNFTLLEKLKAVFIELLRKQCYPSSPNKLQMSVKTHHAEHQIIRAAIAKLNLETEVSKFPELAFYKTIASSQLENLDKFTKTRLHLKTTRLALFLLNGICKMSKPTHMSFLISMPTLFERFMRLLTAEYFLPRRWMVKRGRMNWTTGPAEKSRIIHTDIMVFHKSKCVLVLDAKYKKGGASAADTYQLNAYMTAAHINVSVLLVASKKDQVTQEVVEHTGAIIFVVHVCMKNTLETIKNNINAALDKVTLVVDSNLKKQEENESSDDSDDSDDSDEDTFSDYFDSEDDDEDSSSDNESDEENSDSDDSDSENTSDDSDEQTSSDSDCSTQTSEESDAEESDSSSSSSSEEEVAKIPRYK